MYKPGTQLILNDLWAAAAAHKLGFEVESNPNNNQYVIQKNIGWIEMFLPDARVWRITVTESGPNAAEKFLPQTKDTLADLNWRYLVDDILAEEVENFISVSDARESFSEYEEETHGRGAVRILERNGIPFPQFSKVIKP